MPITPYNAEWDAFQKNISTLVPKVKVKLDKAFGSLFEVVPQLELNPIRGVLAIYPSRPITEDECRRAEKLARDAIGNRYVPLKLEKFFERRGGLRITITTQSPGSTQTTAPGPSG